jgi:hypothetical protein
MTASHRCETCNGLGIIIDGLQEFYYELRKRPPGKKYCHACSMKNHCPVCGGEIFREVEAGQFKVCGACGHDVERAGVVTTAAEFESASGAQRLASAAGRGVGTILRYLTSEGLFVEFKAVRPGLLYLRSYWQRQALTEAAQSIVQAFDHDPDDRLSPLLPEKLFEDMRASVNDLGKLKPAAAAVVLAYEAMPLDHPFGRGLTCNHFDRLRDALLPDVSCAAVKN